MSAEKRPRLSQPPDQAPLTADPAFAPLRQGLLDLCYERTIDGLTPGVVCARAGLPLADFERLFDDLEDCAFQVYAAEFGRYRRRAVRARAAQGNWSGRVRATAYALARFLGEDPKLTNYVVVEVRRAGERCELLVAEAIEELFDLLDEGRAELDDPGSLTRATAESVGGGIFALIVKSVTLGEPVEESELVPQLMHAAVLPYLGHAAADAELSIPPPEPA
jgi:AcrR family transcriptional regulator